MTTASGDDARLLRRHDNDIASIYDMLGTIQTKLVEHDGRFDAVDARFDTIDARFDAVDARFDALGDTLATVVELVRPADPTG